MNINLQLFICRKLGVKISLPERYQAALDACHVISCIKEGEKLLKTHLFFSTLTSRQPFCSQNRAAPPPIPRNTQDL